MPLIRKKRGDFLPYTKPLETTATLQYHQSRRLWILASSPDTLLGAYLRLLLFVVIVILYTYLSLSGRWRREAVELQIPSTIFFRINYISRVLTASVGCVEEEDEMLGIYYLT